MTNSTERRSIALMIAHSFFTGAMTVFFETTASATFLARLDARLLPWVYVAAALVSVIAAGAYAGVRRGFPFLMRGTVVALLVLALGLRGALAISDARWVAFGGLVAYRLVSTLSDLEYWALANRIYDAEQARRLFGLIGTGEVTARLAGSLLVPLVVRALGVRDMLFLSAGAAVACLLLLEALLPLAHGPASVAAPPTPPRRSAFVDALLALAVLATFGKVLVDFAFLRQVGSIHRSEAELATFLGWFGGATQLGSLLLRLFVTRPFLARFGVRSGVLVLPTVHALCCVAILVAAALHSSTGIGLLVIGNQAFYKVLKHPIDNASFKVLYQDLEPGARLGVQVAAEVFFAPIVTGLSGLCMVAMSSVYEPVRFTVLLLLVFGAWIVTGWRTGHVRSSETIIPPSPTETPACVPDRARAPTCARRRGT